MVQRPFYCSVRYRHVEWAAAGLPYNTICVDTADPKNTPRSRVLDC